MAKKTSKTGNDKQEKDDLIFTPGGPRPKSKVHLIEPGYHISGKGGHLRKIETSTGKVVEDYGEITKLPPGKHYMRYSEIKPEGKKKIIAVANAGLRAPRSHDWIINSGWTNNTGNPISYFSTKWIVPPAPPTDDGQLIYLFNGIETATGAFILQPVLQWGDNGGWGGSYWCVANWYADGGSDTHHGNWVKVNPGDVLQGIMTLTNHSGSDYSYLSSFVGLPNADLQVNNVDELVWANETLECYWNNQLQSADYPDAALTALHDIEIKLRTQETPTIIDSEATINWGVQNHHTNNGEHCLIVSNDSPGGDVYLYYRNITQEIYFVNDKSTFGKDEVTDVIADSGGTFSNAFWAVLEGYTIDQISIDQPSPLKPILSGAFSTIPGVTITPNPSGPEYELPGDLYTPQRIRFPFDIQFTSAVLASFPATGNPSVSKVLNAAITIGGVNLSAVTLFELVAGADPYFTNVDPSQDNVFWLSQDLRIFSAAPAINNVPVQGGPTFSTDSIVGAYSYIQNLLAHLNTNYKDPSGTDPFTSLLPGQAGALTGDSSVTPIAVKWGFPITVGANYNFAIARVRLRGSVGPTAAAQNVKVFFRLWSTQSADTDYLAGSTYMNNPDLKGFPGYPLPAADSHTIPFFATDNNPNFSDPNNPEYGTGGVNNRTIQIDSGDYAWAYFGCFLNVYDTSNIVNGSPVQALLNGTHHCIVAQIAYDDSPIVNANGVTMNPENCDKLAQRNLEVTTSDNPGIVDTHRIPQTFDLRPSSIQSQTPGALLDYPDELMINWGNTPEGSVVNIFWPQVDATQVIKLASKLYNTHLLTAPDHNTVQCKVTKGVTYIPIPTGKGENFAGLLTIDLPPTVVRGQEFNIIVRRVTTRTIQEKMVEVNIDTPAVAAIETNRKHMYNWRYVVGTFQIKIPVSTKEAILFPEENTLAVLKWRLEAMSPSNRWYPVLNRYISYVAARVDGFGGNSAEIKPSLQGAPVKKIEKEISEFTGKICEVMFDCFGDFVGFVLCSCSEKHFFRSREKAIGELALRACKERLLVSVWFEKAKPEHICKMVIQC